jgi:hypothetical protein
MSPRVKTIIETPRRLEPVTSDPFIEGLEAPAPPRVEKPLPVPAPRLRLAAS